MALVAVALAHAVGAQDDDHGDSYADSTLLGIGATVPGALGRQDTDVFRLELVGTAQVEARTVGQTDTRGELLDSDGARLLSDDDSGPGRNFHIEATLDPGVYYVSVEGAVGAYSINARLGGDRDHGDTPESSTVLKLHTSAELARVQPSVLLATSGRIYPSRHDVDVFRLDVAEDNTKVALRTSPRDYDTTGVLTNAMGTQLAADYGSDAFQITTVLNAGIYYVAVSAMETGAYRILGQGDAGSASTTRPVGERPPARRLDNLFGTWAGAWQWRFLDSISTDAWVFDRILGAGGYRFAVERDFEPAMIDDLDDSFYVGALSADFDPSGDSLHDYLVLYRGFDILCKIYFFDLVSPTLGDDDGLMLFGDVVGGECDFTDASVYDWRLARLWSPQESRNTRGSGVDRPSVEARRQLVLSERERLRSLNGAEARPVPARIRHVLSRLEAIDP